MDGDRWRQIYVFGINKIKQSVVACIPLASRVSGGLRQEHWKFEATLGYIVRLCLKITKFRESPFFDTLRQ